MRKTRIIKNEEFKDVNLYFSKENVEELVVFKDCSFDNVRLYTYSGKLRLYDCKFENKSKIVDLSQNIKNQDNLIEIIRLSTRSFGQNLEIIAPIIYINLPTTNINGLIIYADIININGNSKEVKTAAITYKDKICVNDTIMDDVFLNNLNNAEEYFDNSYINGVLHPFKMFEIKQKKLK